MAKEEKAKKHIIMDEQPTAVLSWDDAINAPELIEARKAAAAKRRPAWVE